MACGNVNGGDFRFRQKNENFFLKEIPGPAVYIIKGIHKYSATPHGQARMTTRSGDTPRSFTLVDHQEEGE